MLVLYDSPILASMRRKTYNSAMLGDEGTGPRTLPNSKSEPYRTSGQVGYPFLASRKLAKWYIARIGTMRFLRRRPMRRREFMTVVGAAVIGVPIAAPAQQRAMPVIGFLNSASADGYAVMADAFKQGLKEAGYIEGQNVTIEYRWANNAYERLPGLAADLVKRKVDVIVANSPSIAPAIAATTTI